MGNSCSLGISEAQTFTSHFLGNKNFQAVSHPWLPAEHPWLQLGLIRILCWLHAVQVQSNQPKLGFDTKIASCRGVNVVAIDVKI